MKKNTVLASMGVLSACALLLSYIEFLLLPSLFIPGVKWGLCNAMTLIALYMLGKKQALFISLVRVVLSAALFSGIAGLLYSLPAALSAWGVMSLLKKWGFCTPVGVSSAGAGAHITVQFCVGAVLLGNTHIFTMLPLAGCLCTGLGSLTGYISEKILHALKTHNPSFTDIP